METALNEGDYNFKGSALERGVAHEPTEREDGYISTFLDKTKIKTPEPTTDSALTLGNTEGAETREGDYNFEGSALERGAPYEPKETEEGYGSSFLHNTKIKTPEPLDESAVTLDNTEGAETKKGDYNFEGSGLESGVPHEPKETEDGYTSTFLEKTKIKTPEPQSDSALTLETTEGAELREGDYNFEGSGLERGAPYEPKETEEAYGSTFLDNTKIKTPEPQNESAVTLENTEGSETRKGDYNFEGSALERGVPHEPKETEDAYGSTFLEKTQIKTPEPQGEGALTLSNSDYNENKEVEDGETLTAEAEESNAESTQDTPTQIPHPGRTATGGTTVPPVSEDIPTQKPHPAPAATGGASAPPVADETPTQRPQPPPTATGVNSGSADTAPQDAALEKRRHKKESFLTQLKHKLPGHHKSKAQTAE